MDEVGIFVSCAVKSKIITLERMKKMKSNAIVGNIWHFDNKIGMDGLNASQASRLRTLNRKWTAARSSGLSSQSRA